MSDLFPDIRQRLLDDQRREHEALKATVKKLLADNAAYWRSLIPPPEPIQPWQLDVIRFSAGNKQRKDRLCFWLATPNER